MHCINHHNTIGYTLINYINHVVGWMLLLKNELITWSKNCVKIFPTSVGMI